MGRLDRPETLLALIRLLRQACSASPGLPWPTAFDRDDALDRIGEPQISANWQKSTGFGKIGGAEGDRTPDLVIANDALSQLSYGPVKERCL